MDVTFSKTAPPKTAALVAPVFEKADLEALLAAVDPDLAAHAAAAAKANGFGGKSTEILEIAAPPGVPNPRLVLVGLGKADGFAAAGAERLGARMAARLSHANETAAVLLLDLVDAEPEICAHAAFGAGLRAYRFDRYRTVKTPDAKPGLAKLTVRCEGARAARTAYDDLAAVAHGVEIARNLVSEPANVLYPKEFAARCQALAELGLKVQVLGEKEMAKLGMGALLGVGQGSERESQLVVMDWRGGAKGAAPVALVGKGVTFDTGGISIKPAAGMEAMKWDMGGAAAVTGAMAALAGRGAKVNAVGVIGLVENMPDGRAQRPGDVVTSMSGQTIEVINTDAEGRLVLADALHYVQKKYKPTAIVDLATLTGAIIVSLANEYAGLFTPDDDLARQLTDAGAAVHEPVWRMPMGKAFDKMIDSPIADMKNVGGSGGGSITAAQFLKRFVTDTPWAHLDIAGMAWTDKDKGVTPKGGVGFGVRLLDRWVRDVYEKT